MHKTIYPSAPFDFLKILRRPLSRPARGILINVHESSYTRCVALPSGPCPVTVQSVGTIDEPELRVSYPDGLNPRDEERVIDIVKRMFDTEVHLDAFYEAMVEPQWVSLLTDLRGVRLIHDADIFESMVKVIVGQQLNVKFAATLVERLIDLAGTRVEWQGNEMPVFPNPTTVANLSYDVLRSLSFSQRKAEYVIDFARSVANGDLHLDALWTMSDEQVYDAMIPVRGVGRWTIECLLLFGLGRRDIMPAADIGVQNAIQKLYAYAERPKEEEIRTMAEAWKPWRSYATYYLWQSLIP